MSGFRGGGQHAILAAHSCHARWREHHAETVLNRASARSPRSSAHRAAGPQRATVYGGHEHQLRQTLIALKAGEELAEHNSPGEATVHVLHGRVELTSGEDSWVGALGDLLVVPPARHALKAEQDAVVLLTVVKRAE